MSELEQVLISVWRQALVEGAKRVAVDGKKYPVKTTAKRGLKQVDFWFEDHELRGLEQNPETKSRCPAQSGSVNTTKTIAASSFERYRTKNW
jgi:hypothetical protein